MSIPRLGGGPLDPEARAPAGNVATRLILLPPLLVALASAVVWIGAEQASTRFAYEQATDVVRIQARVAAGLVQDLEPGAGPLEFDTLADRVGGLSGLRTTYIDTDGAVLGDSRLPTIEIAQLENHGDRPEVRDALEYGEGIARRYSKTLGADLLYVGVPYEHGDRRGTARVSRPLLDVESRVRRGRGLMLGLALATVLVASWLVYVATSRMRATLQREHERSEARITGRIERIRRLQEAGSALSACESVDETARIVRATVELLVPRAGGALALFKSSRNQLQRVLAWGDGEQGETLYPPSACWALRRGMAHYTSGGNPGTRCEHLDDLGDAPVLCMPLQAHGEMLGVLQIVPPNAAPFTGEALDLIQTMTEHAAVTLGNIQLNQALREQAIRDPLTGLFNRRYLSESLEREIARATRRADMLAVLMVDIDHFKDFNDRFGHEAGDHVLSVVGQLIGDSTRDEDVACRYGGEEFVLVLVGSDGPHAREVGQRLCDAVRNLPLVFAGTTLNRISVSVGVAILASGGETSGELLKRADEMLYAAKQSGRNQVVVAESGSHDG